MAAFAQFASDLDPATQRLLARGSRLTELLKQPQFSPLSIEEQVCVIFAGVRGYLDRVAIGDITRFEQSYRAELKAKAPDILDAVRKDREISNATEEKLKGFLDQFLK